MKHPGPLDLETTCGRLPREIFNCSSSLVQRLLDEVIFAFEHVQGTFLLLLCKWHLSSWAEEKGGFKVLYLDKEQNHTFRNHLQSHQKWHKYSLPSPPSPHVNTHTLRLAGALHVPTPATCHSLTWDAKDYNQGLHRQAMCSTTEPQFWNKRGWITFPVPIILID